MKINFIVFLFFLGCSNFNSNNIDNLHILATIGDRVITVSDFIKRAEYNVRPSYCSGNSLNEKKIILNSLIAEKLFALKFNSNLKKSHYQLIDARKEQKMREVLFNRDIYNNIKLDSFELSNAYGNSIKEFDISYISLPQKEPLLELFHLINDSLYTLEKIAKIYFNIDKVPIRKLKFDKSTNEDMYKMFYSKNIQIGDTYGPVLIDDYFSIFRVDNWKEIRNLSGLNKNNAISLLSKKIKGFKSHIEYRNYINSIMYGKELVIHPENFEKLVASIHSDIENIAINKSEYIINDLLKNKDFSKHLSNSDVIFTISDIEWTIGGFNSIISKNPIDINPKVNLFKLKKRLKELIINKLETYYITKAAYEKGIDQHSLVKQEEILWSDYIKTTQVINNISSISKVPKDSYDFIENILNPFVDSLLSENSEYININENYFSNISLTSIDMHVLFKEQSNKLVVPLFPMITSRSKQNYLN